MAEEIFEKEVLEKLGELDRKVTNVEACLTSVQEGNDRCTEWLKDHQVEIHGKQESKGLRDRVSELESTQERQTWVTRSVIGGLIASAVGWVWSLLRGGGS